MNFRPLNNKNGNVIVVLFHGFERSHMYIPYKKTHLSAHDVQATVNSKSLLVQESKNSEQSFKLELVDHCTRHTFIFFRSVSQYWRYSLSASGVQ